MVYHTWNRANFGSPLFQAGAHYQDFLALVEESLNFVATRILAYCLMPNHWHLALYPRADGDLAKFMQRITLTHTPTRSGITPKPGQRDTATFIKAVTSPCPSKRANIS